MPATDVMSSATTGATMLHRGTEADDRRYAAVVARDRSMDGTFFYAVRTTGVFCRPSCGSRRPRRENVSFHASVEEAQAAGFRPCKRCRPEQLGTDLHAEVVIAACRMIDGAIAKGEPLPALDDLARRTGYSPFHLHRLFKKATGLTPRGYAAAVRAGKLHAVLPASRSVSEAVHGAGYSSTSRFYEASTGRLGMTPAQARRGGAGEVVRFAVGESSLGPVLVAATAKGICAIQFGRDAEVLVHELERRFPHAELVGDDPAFASVVAQVVAHVEEPRTRLDLPLDIRGTSFQERVWQELRRIAPGETTNYTAIARRLGKPQAARAVAQACASNELAVAIPCHRVVRMSGDLAGYRWGLERKEALLQREGALAPHGVAL